jgi:antitoxin (DNA-binding transcriptional repressor) of toxin-antitoxin stability system
MKKAMISDLKNRLSYYLRFVRRGESVLVLDRDRAIARIEPIGDGDAPDDVAELIRTGALRSPSAPLPPGWVARRTRIQADVVGTLLAERATGR